LYQWRYRLVTAGDDTRQRQ